MSINSDVVYEVDDTSSEGRPLFDSNPRYVSATAQPKYGSETDEAIPEDDGPRGLERAEAFITDNGVQLTIIWLIILVNAVVFFHGATVGYDAKFAPPDNWARPLGRGFGEVLNLNCALVLLPMCHALWFFLQGTRVSVFLPTDRLLLLHKIFAYLCVIGTLPHAGVGIRIYVLSIGTPSFREGFGGFVQILITGVVATVVLAVIFFTSRGCVRRGRHFELFWYAHHLFIVYELAMLLHGFQFGQMEYYKYLAAPGLIYVLDRMYRVCSAGGVGMRVSVLSARVLAGTVTLELEKPCSFVFRAGMYATLRCDAISKHEWHAVRSFFLSVRLSVS